MYYGTILLEKVGMGQGGSLYANVLIGLVSVIASIFGTRLIARYNTHRMLLIGLLGNIFFLDFIGLGTESKSVFTASQKYFGSPFLSVILS